MSEMPQGWAKSTLGEICSKPQYGWTSRAGNDGKVQYLRTTDISGGCINWESVPYCVDEPEELKKYQLETNDIVVSRAGSVGVSYRLEVVPLNVVFASYLIRFKALEGIAESKFIELFLKSGDYWRAISEISAGIAIPNVNASKLSELVVPLPPLKEQRRIIAKAEELLAKVDTGQTRLVKIPVILKRFRQAVLAAACTGRLTADFREVGHCIESASEFVQRAQKERKAAYEQQCAVAAGNGQRKPKRPKNEFVAFTDESADGLPENWCVSRIGDVSECLDHLRIPINKSERQAREGNIPYYGANGQVGWINEYLFDEELVLVVEDETFIGREKPFSYIIKGKSWVNNHAHVLRPIGEMSVEFLNICLSYYDFTPLTSGSTGRRKLTQEALIDAPLLIAPLSEQQAIVRRVNSFFSLADQLEVRYLKAKSYVDKLSQSILAKAFRGELVPQDPNDEPAAVLLERIRTERSKTTAAASRMVTARPARKKSASKSVPTPTPKLRSDPVPLTTEPAVVASGLIPDRILNVMQPGRDYTRADITAASGISDAEWAWAIKQLQAKGKVKQNGERRGAKYTRR